MRKFPVCILAIALCLVSCGEKKHSPHSVGDSASAYTVESGDAPESAGGGQSEDALESAREEQSEETQKEALESGSVESGALTEAEISARDSLPPESSAAPQTASPEASVSRSKILPDIDTESRMDEAVIERELLRLINEERAAVGAEALGEEENMRFAARIRSTEVMEELSHTRPNGGSYNTAFDEAGFSYAGKWHGENLASIRFTRGMLDEKGIALEMFTGLKNSPGHYSNMINTRFLQAGIGVSLSQTDGIVSASSAQLFSSL